MGIVLIANINSSIIVALISLIILVVPKISKLENIEKSEVPNVIKEAKDGIETLKIHKFAYENISFRVSI